MIHSLPMRHYRRRPPGATHFWLSLAETGSEPAPRARASLLRTILWFAPVLPIFAAAAVATAWILRRGL